MMGQLVCLTTTTACTTVLNDREVVSETLYHQHNQLPNVVANNWNTLP